jgi:uncharacterized protein (TIGR00375 family)
LFIADLHIHSKYSRATSKNCVPEVLDLWARQKGLNLIGTGDFTHAAWRAELREKLEPAEEGLYALKKAHRLQGPLNSAAFSPRFMVSGEISGIYKKNGKVRKVHSLILLPSLEAADALALRLEAIGNLHSDGRPILGLDSRDLLEITLESCPEAMLIPAHIWTPHFSLFGAYSGFDSIQECFEDLSCHIHALETGLSADPPMNWRLSALDHFAMVSNSDAHSPANLAREANLFDCALSYAGMKNALEQPPGGGFQGTLEFFPEEGKYHYDGHRSCGVCQRPADTIAAGGVCPICGGRITVGVLHRVERLADRPEGFKPKNARHFESLVPLPELIAASTGHSPASREGKRLYTRLLTQVGPELFTLRLAPLEEIKVQGGALIAEGIRRLREGRVEIRPGFDGEYGRVKIIDRAEFAAFSGQLSLLPGAEKGHTQRPETPKAKKEGKKLDFKAVLAQNDGALPKGLNPEQERAVLSASPVVAVIAGPGTGKTQTLVSRIQHLIHSGVPAGEIVALTFTNKAAAEMRARLSTQLGGGQAALPHIGSFHSVCLRLLGAEECLAVLDDGSALSLLEELIGELGLKLNPREGLSEISRIKNGAKTLDEAAGLPAGLYEAYCERLGQYGVIDYDDILLKALQAEGGGFAYILVDEFQDTNPLQYALLRKWSQGCKGLFVIGDPNQSIYGFRGADSRCFAWIERDYPSAETIRLLQNYRSTPEILRCAAGALKERRGQALQAARPSGGPVRLFKVDTTLAEAIFVAKRIAEFIGGADMLGSEKRGKKGEKANLYGLSEIAVLYRTNRQARLLEDCLGKEGIPYTVTGREEHLGAPEAQGVLGFFRFLLNPADLLALRSALRAYGASAAEAASALARYMGEEKGLASLARILGEAHPFCALLHRFAPLARARRPDSLLEKLVAMGPGGPFPSLEKLLGSAACHEDMASFLRIVALGQEGDLVRRGGKSYAKDAVSLMTLHAAKGLEFPVVFVCGLTEGVLPFVSYKGESDPDEERRLFYVGMTRAKNELLLLSGPKPSPFLSALPRDSLLEELAFARRPSASQTSLF